MKNHHALVAVLALAFVALPVGALADTPNRVGGHAGAVVPLVNRSGGSTTTVADDFLVGFPAGIKVGQLGPFVVDFEVVPMFQNAPRKLSLELHPGVVMKVSDSLAAGLRAAVDVEGNAWGVTPLVNRTVYVAASHSLFVEAVVPVRFADNGAARRRAVGFGVHLGVGF